MAALLWFLFSLVPSLKCFPWQAFGEISPRQLASEDVRKGNIVFNGKPESERLWGLVELSLQCGPRHMKLKVVGRGAADLALDLGAGSSQPLSKALESCGYLLRGNAFGLVLVVPYDGCHVVQENGYYVLRMIYLQTPITLTCPSPALTAGPPSPLPITRNTYRSKRQAYDPYQQYYLNYLYYMNMMANNPQTTVPPQPVYNPIYHQFGYNPSKPTTLPSSDSFNHPRYLYPQQYPYCYIPNVLCPYFPYYPGQKQPMEPTTQAPTTSRANTVSTTTRRPCKQSTSTTTPAGCKPTTTSTKAPLSTSTTPSRCKLTTTTRTDAAKPTCKPKTTTPNKLFTPYAQHPFAPEISSIRKSQIPRDPKRVPYSSYKSAPLPNYQYWFAQAVDQDPHFDWDGLEP
nr:mucin-2-like [Nerophis lumbriciformis]